MKARKRPAEKPASGGFSLLEVVLALAILTGAIAVLGQVVRTGIDNARMARDLTQAQLYAESLMAEIAAGVIPAEPASSVPLDDKGNWTHSIVVEPLNDEGLLHVAVTVEQRAQRPIRPFTVVRWMRDPETQVSASQGTSSTSTSSSSSGSGGSQRSSSSSRAGF
ncbi:MAG: hypothetical protein WD847_15375 [Pirellulales bacterium]